MAKTQHKATQSPDGSGGGSHAMAPLGWRRTLTTLWLSPGLLLRTLLWARRAGVDANGNLYYHMPKRKRRMGRAADGREQRWVFYAPGHNEAGLPPAWHGWLAHASDTPPPPQKEKSGLSVYEATGSDAAWLRRGSPLRQGKRERATGDYQPWRPPPSTTP